MRIGCTHKLDALLLGCMEQSPAEPRRNVSAAKEPRRRHLQALVDRLPGTRREASRYVQWLQMRVR